MRGIWRKCLGLSAGLLIAPAQAAEPPGPPARPAIARSAPAATLGRPIGVSLGRPRPAGESLPAEDAVRQTTFHGAPPARPLVSRAAAPDLHPMPPGPPAGPFVSAPFPVAPPTGSEALPAPRPAGPVPGPAPAPAPSGHPGVAWDGHAVWTAPGWDGPECCDGCACPGDGCGNLFYFSSEYLLYWIDGTRFPPLATSGPALPAPVIPGALSAPGTAVLFGGASMGRQEHSGYRLRAGVWLNRAHTAGLEGSFFSLTERDEDFLATSTGLPVLAVPFLDPAGVGFENAFLVASPGARMGTLRAELETRLWSAEINLRRKCWDNPCGGPCTGIDLLAGFRGIALDDNFELTATSMVLAPPMGTVIVQDRFETRNRFYGGQLGARAEFCWGRLSIDVTGKVALGNTHQRVEVGGNTVVGGLSGPGGLFARPSNSGVFERDRFTAIPEVGINVGYQLTDCLRAFAGYNFLYWNNVARPGEQIDRVVQLAPGMARPVFAFRDSDFWIHGLSAGLELRY